jgi:hypothetical protein
MKNSKSLEDKYKQSFLDLNHILDKPEFSTKEKVRLIEAKVCPKLVYGWLTKPVPPRCDVLSHSPELIII